jgi:hypothetical protein
MVPDVLAVMPPEPMVELVVGLELVLAPIPLLVVGFVVLVDALVVPPAPTGRSKT